MTLHRVHEANTEKHEGEFDICAEQAALERMCRDETIQVAEIMGEVAAVASTKGIVCMVPSHQLLGKQEPTPGMYIVYFWRGRLYNAAFRRNGIPFSFGPYDTQFYNRERVAEILSRQKEVLR